MRQHLVEAFPIGRLERVFDVFRDRPAVVVMNRQTKPLGAAGERHADPPHPDDAEPLPPDPVPEHRGRTPTGPAAAADQPFSFGEPARDREDQRHRHIRGVLGQDTRRVGHDDAALLRRREIDMVDAGPERGDQLERRTRGGQHLGVDSVADGRHQNIGLTDRGDQLGSLKRFVGQVEPAGKKLHHPGLNRVRELAGDDHEWPFRPHGDDVR